MRGGIAPAELRDAILAAIPELKKYLIHL